MSPSVISVGRNGGIDHVPRRTNVRIASAFRSVRCSSSAGKRALILDAQRIGARQHRAAVVADAGAVTRRAAVLELGLPALDGGRVLRRRDAARQQHERDRRNHCLRRHAHDRIPPRIDRNAAGQTPARPGEMMPFGSMASFNVSLKRRSAKLLNEYWSATSSCRIGGAR